MALFLMKAGFYALIGALLSMGGISVMEKPGTFFLILFSVVSIEAIAVIRSRRF